MSIHDIPYCYHISTIIIKVFTFLIVVISLLYRIQTAFGSCTHSFLDCKATSTIPYKYSNRQRTACECRCAYGARSASLKGSHVYEINTWLWAFGRPQPRIGSLSVAKTQRIRKASRSEAAKRAWETKRALAQNDRFILGIYHLVYTICKSWEV